MMSAVSILVVTLTAALAAPALDASTGLANEDYFTIETDKNILPEQIILPQKRAALVLDRLLIALQQALQEESTNQRMESDRDGPRTSPLRLANIETNDLTGLQRRGQTPGRGRVLRCYFNAVTCF